MNNSEYLIECKDYYSQNKLIPFIGAGFSAPLGLPDWNELLSLIAKDLDFEPQLFLLHGNNQQLAEYLYLNDKLWDKFIHNISINFNSLAADDKRRKSYTHKILGELNFKKIYTTNYDHHIEEALRDGGKKVNVIATLLDFLRSSSTPDCEVIKFHGTLEEPTTLILTETRYFERMELEEAVDQRLRSDILDNSFLFIGYGFGDPNIRYIWYKIDKLRRLALTNRRNIVNLRPSYYISFDSGPIQPELLNQWQIKVINLDPTDKENSLLDFLKKFIK